MSAKKIQITDSTQNLSFNGRYENLAQQKRPPVIAKTASGDEVHEVTCYQGKPLRKGSTKRQWLDAADKVHSKDSLQFFIGDDEVEEVSQTKVFEIEGYQDVTNYTDAYVMSAYYEIFPDDDGMTKDIDRERAVYKNTMGMKKLWEYLRSNNQVARGEFCPSTRGFVYSDGYIRAIKMGTKWGLEIGVFKEEKVFNHLNDGVMEAPKETTTKKRVKMI